jgi:phage baseplate assembly protein W
MSRSLTFPFSISELGAPQVSPHLRTIREQVEQILFTIPGERVNRPSFGCGVQRLVFGGCSPEVAAATEYVINVNLREFMGDVIAVDAVRVTADPEQATLIVDLLYTVRTTGEERADSFRRALEAAP